VTKKQSHNRQSVATLSKGQRETIITGAKNKADKAAEAKPQRLLYLVSTLPALLAAICAAIMLVNVLQLFAAYTAMGNHDRMNITTVANLGGMALLCVCACVFAALLYNATQLRRRTGRQAQPPSTSTPS
jgi:hypothetical protein